MIAMDGRTIGQGEPCYVIAEAGVNHNGELHLARRLIDATAKAGADAVKFQTFDADRLAGADAPKAAYQQQTTDPVQSQRDMLAALQLSADDHRVLIDHCRSRRITFLSSPFDERSADLLIDLGVAAIKLGSGELTNGPLLRHVGAAGRPVLLSTGMSTIDEVAEAVDVLRAAGCDELVLLHCVSSYPAPPQAANLRTMAAMRDRFGVPVGWSDHCPGHTTALAAAAAGAAVIEKHLTLDRAMPGPDHAASIEPDEFARMVRAIRDIDAALGDGAKRPMPCEADTRAVARRSVVTACDIPQGTAIEPTMLTSMRPAAGISPMKLDALIGRRAARDLRAGHMLEWTDVQ